MQNNLINYKNAQNSPEDPNFVAVDFAETGFQKTVRTKGIYIAMIMTATGLFVGIPMLFWFATSTIVNVGALLLMLFICGAMGLMQWRYVHQHLDIAYHQFTMYAFAGFGMCSLNLILLINYSINIGTYSENYVIVNTHFNNGSYEVELSNPKGVSPSVESGIGYFIGDQYKRLPKSKNISVTFSKGLFGMDIVTDCKFN